MPLHVSSTCAHHQEVKIALHSLWYHQTYSCALHSLWYHHTYRCDDTRGCVKQFWPPDDEQMCSKHVEAWNKLIVKQQFCASSWLITEIKKYAHIYLLLNYSTYFGRPSRPSSGVHKNVAAASGTDHTIWGASGMDARNMQSNLAVNKYVHTVASCWIYSTFSHFY